MPSIKDPEHQPGPTGTSLPSGIRWVALAIMVSGLVTSALVARVIRSNELRLVELEFHQRGSERAQAIEREFKIIVEHIESIAAVYATYGGVDRGQFSSLATSMLDEHPTIQALGINLVVTAEGRAAHELAMHDAGHSGYTITERDPYGELVPATSRASHVVVTFIEPLTGNEEALGYDIGSEPVRREALERAITTGAPAMTGRIRLVQEHGEQYGALICVPLFVGSMPHDIGRRRDALRGFAVGVVRYGDAVEQAVKDFLPAGIDLIVEDISSGGGEGSLHFHASRTRAAGNSAASAKLAPFVRTFEIGGRRFSVRGTALSLWHKRLSTMPIVIFIFGIGISFTIAGYLLWQATISRRVLQVIAQRKSAQQRQAAFGRMLDESHDEIYIFDAGTLQFVHVNEGARRNLGYSKEELSTMTPYDLKPEMDPGWFEELIRSMREGNKPKAVFTTVHRRKDGTQYDVEVHLQYSLFDGAPTYIAMILDVTERKRIDERLRQSQRIEALGTLAGGIAHDFNNVLAAVMGYAELSRDQVPPDSRVAANLAKIVRASERARDVVGRILTFSRGQVLERRPVDINQLVSETLQLMRASLPASVELRQEVETACMVDGDQTQLHQVMVNLCTNAGQAMTESGGVLTVRVDSVDLASPDLERLGIANSGRNVRIRVHDTGRGIRPEVAEHVFEPFFTTKPAGQGNGMGLAVAHGIVEAHNGAIRIHSEQGSGTMIEVLLPAANDRRPIDEGKRHNAIGGKETILVVDDEPAIVDVVHAALTGFGYCVESFSDPLAALSRFLERPARFDLVITDQSMPGLSGTEFARRIRDVRPGLPLILISGFGEMLDEAAIRQAGVTSVLAKPQRMSDLREVVRDLLDQANGPS